MPSSKYYVRDYKQEQVTARKRGETKKRAKRNKARADAFKTGKAHKGDGKDVGHIKSLKSGGSNKPKNTKSQTRYANRSAGGKTGNVAGKARGGRIGKPRGKAKTRRA